MTGLTIGGAARAATVNVETIRFYERRGLVDQPRKPERPGARTYPPETVARIRFIKEAQQLGFSLSEIRDLLALRADPAAGCADVRVQAIAKLDDVHEKIQRLRRVARALETLIASCPGRGAMRTCTILDALSAGKAAPAVARKAAPSRTQSRPKKEPAMKTTTFRIEGMHCDGCAVTIRTLVEKEAGVKAVDVSHKDGTARVLFDPKTVDERKLVVTIQRPGFRVVGRA